MLCFFLEQISAIAIQGIISFLFFECLRPSLLRLYPNRGQLSVMQQAFDYRLSRATMTIEILYIFFVKCMLKFRKCYSTVCMLRF